MATSPNYSWAEPDNSSLVKNGAQDIRALGDAIDTSVWNIGFGQAGKNKIINGDFGIWQRGTSFTNPNGVYTADRFLVGVATAVPSWIVSQQAFAAGTAPVAGYESTYFYRAALTAQSGSTAQIITHRIEDVRTLAGQPVTVSFWAKADSAKSMGAVVWGQNFGSGGSAAVETTVSASTALTTSWARYSYTFTAPALTGKTVGTSSYIYLQLWMPGTATYTWDLWGLQVEYGSKATPFETATGTIQGELAACQRYYWRNTAGETLAAMSGASGAGSTTEVDHAVVFPVPMRVRPTSLDYSALGTYDFVTTYTTGTYALIGARSGTQFASIRYTHPSGALTQYRPYQIIANSSAAAYIGLSAEL